MIRVLTAVVALALLAACSKPAMPEKDKPVEPKAAVDHGDLRRAIDAPLARTRASRAAQDAAAKAQESALDAAADGAPAP